MNSQLLYHYTTPVALHKILDCGFLQASNALCLKDKSECRLAIDCLGVIIPRIKLNKLWHSLEDTLLSRPRYVVSFSKLRNDAYMWEKYGAKGTGACIVVDTIKLRSIWESFECKYYKRELFPLVQQFSIYWKECGDKAIEDKMNDIRNWNISFKRKKFHREAEVRYVYTPNPKTPIAIVKDPHVSMLATQISECLNSYSDEFCGENGNDFMPFYLNGAIHEIILGPRYPKYIGNYGRFEAVRQ